MSQTHAAKNSTHDPPFWAGDNNTDNLHNSLLPVAVVTILYSPQWYSVQSSATLLPVYTSSYINSERCAHSSLVYMSKPLRMKEWRANNWILFTEGVSRHAQLGRFTICNMMRTFSPMLNHHHRLNK